MSTFIQNDLRVFVAPVDIFKTDLSSSEKLIYLALQSFANPHKAEAFPSYQTIANMCSLSRRRVIDLVSNLIEKGYITKEIRLDVSKNRKIRNTSNLYTINSPSKVVQPLHQGSETISPSLVQPFHQGSETVSPKQNNKNNTNKNNTNNNKADPNNKLSRMTKKTQTSESVVVEKSELETFLQEKKLKVNETTLNKWRSLDSDSNIIQAVQEALQKTNVRNVIGYITRMLEVGYTPSKSSQPVLQNGLPTYEHEKNIAVSIEEQKEAIELLFKLEEIGEVEYKGRLGKLKLE